MDNYAVKLFESLQKLKVTDENKAEVEKIKQDIRKKDFKKALGLLYKKGRVSLSDDVVSLAAHGTGK